MIMKIFNQFNSTMARHPFTLTYLMMSLMIIGTMGDSMCNYPTTGGIAISTDSNSYGDFEM